MRVPQREDRAKARTDAIGPPFARIRKGRGLPQEKLGEAVGVSQRVIAYYEADDAQPPGPMLPDLARALGVSADELLGLEPVRGEVATPRAARLLERLRTAAELPPAEQRAIITFAEALLDMASQSLLRNEEPGQAAGHPAAGAKRC